MGEGGGREGIWSKRKSNEDAFKNHTGEVTQWTINFNAGLGEERVIYERRRTKHPLHFPRQGFRKQTSLR